MADGNDGRARPERLPTSLLLAISVVGLALRLAFGLGYWNDKPLTRDEHEYLSLARSIAAGDGFVYDEVMRSGSFVPFGRAPGYPAFLALSGGGSTPASSVPAAVKVAQAVVGALGVFVVGLLAWQLGGARMSITAAGIAAVYPPLVWISAYALSEALFWPLGLATVWLLDRALVNRSLVFSGVAGLALGAGVLVRPGLLIFVGLTVLWLLARRRLATVVVLATATLAVLGPWTARNFMHHGKLVVVASDGGVTFWTGNHPRAIGEGDMAANLAIKLDNQALRARHPGFTEEQMEPIYYREAFAWMRAHPIDWIALEFRKLFYLVVPVGPSYALHSPLYYWASIMSYGSVLPFAIAGFMKLGPRRHRSPALWLMAISAIAVCLVFFPQERFRIPTIDPTLIICAGAAFAVRRERT